ncbi:MAG: DUF6449 domain-containing protein, partial [Clostridiales bacterium]|nr:DUF6449 domain-containing protein [Clostridiales bacterium]
MTYHLKNGFNFTRSFPIGNRTFRISLDAIYSLQEYEENYNPLFHIDPRQFIRFAVLDDYSDNITSLTQEEVSEVLKTLREEYRASPGIDQIPYKNPVCMLLFSNSDYDEDNSVVYFDSTPYNYEYQFSIYPNYTNTIKLIEQYTNKSYGAFPEGTKAVLCNWLKLGLWDGFDYNMADDYDELDLDIVTDPDEMQILRDTTVKYCNAEVMNSGFFIQ